MGHTQAQDEKPVVRVAVPEVPTATLASLELDTARAPSIPKEPVLSLVPEKFESRFAACVQATTPLTLCDTRLGPVIEQGGAVGVKSIHSPSELWSKTELHSKISALIAEANPAPDTTTLMGRIRALGKRLFSEPKVVPPHPSPELREAILQMAAFVERGREAELKEVLSQALVNTTAVSHLNYWAPDCGSGIGLDAVLSWFDGEHGRSLGYLAGRLALSRKNTAKWLEELQGLVPGAPAEERREASERLAKALNRPQRDKVNLWNADEVYEKVYMDRRNLGYVSLYIVGPVPSKDAELLAREGRMIAGQSVVLTGAIPAAPATVSTLITPDCVEIALHEGDHVVTEMCRTTKLIGLSFEGRMLDEMRSQLGDSNTSIAQIREVLLSYYVKSYAEFALISIGTDGEAENLVPGTPEADREIRRFIDQVETLLEQGISRDEIRAVLRFTSTLPEFYTLLKDLPKPEGATGR